MELAPYGGSACTCAGCYILHEISSRTHNSIDHWRWPDLEILPNFRMPSVFPELPPAFDPVHDFSLLQMPDSALPRSFRARITRDGMVAYRDRRRRC